MKHYRETGLLQGHTFKNKFLYEPTPVQELKRSKEIAGQLGHMVKELYVLWHEDTPAQILQTRSGIISFQDLELALRYYGIMRSSQFPSLPKELLLTRETAARLKISNPRPIYELLEDNVISCRYQGKTRFVELSSLKGYLGPRMGEPLFVSHEVASMHSIPVEMVPRMAADMGLSMKLQEKRSIIYLFTRYESARRERQYLMT